MKVHTLRALSVAVAFLGVVAASRAQALEKKLISTKLNLHAGAWTAQPDPDFFIKFYPLRGGKQDGVDLLVISNGKLEVALIPTRGLAILYARTKEFRIGWDSPVKDVVHPRHINLTARGGLGWLEGFNELLCRCGLENNGQAGPDEITNNVGDKVTVDLTLHGKIANIPVAELDIAYTPGQVTVTARVEEKMLFGPKLELHAKFITTANSLGFRITDVVKNAGAQPQEFQMLYHANIGSPILEKGAKFLAPVERVTPYNARAARDVDNWNTYLGPTPGYVEQVYLLRPLGDADNKTAILLHNAKADRGISMSYSLKRLPYLTLWKNTGAREDGYVTGLEPGTNYPNRRAVERKAGRVPRLAPGVSYPMTVDYHIHPNKSAIAEASERIRAIQNDKRMIIDKEPPN